jgi:CTD kinase subunit gamma
LKLLASSPLPSSDIQTIDTTPNSKKRPHPSSLTNFSRNDTIRRMEEDRERHKRLREGMWVLPIPGVRTVLPPQPSDRPVARGVSKLKAGPALVLPTHLPLSSSTNTSPSSPSDNLARNKTNDDKRPENTIALEHAVVDPIDVEFEQLWETLSDFGDEDKEDILQ